VYILIDIRKDLAMRVSKWGNSLAVRLPKALVSELGLKDGDEVALQRGGQGQLDVTRLEARAAAVARMKNMRLPIPADYKFDRDEANSR
jgi:antitoxin MazE